MSAACTFDDVGKAGLVRVQKYLRRWRARRNTLGEQCRLLSAQLVRRPPSLTVRIQCGETLDDFGYVEGCGIERTADPFLEFAMLWIDGVGQRGEEIFVARRVLGGHAFSPPMQRSRVSNAPARALDDAALGRTACRRA